MVAAAGNSNCRSTDPLGRLKTIKDANQHSTSFDYDALSRQTKKSWPDGSFESYAYDKYGNPIHFTPVGATAPFTSTYDVLNRLVQLQTNDGQTFSYGYDLLGNRTAVTTTLGTTTYTFDNQNRVTQLVRSGANTPNVAYSYNAAGQRTGITTTVGTSVNGTIYTYDLANRLASTSNAASGTTSYGYDPVGNRTAITMPNGVVFNYTWDTLNRLTNLTQTKGGTTLASYAYTLGLAGNRLRVDEGDGSNTGWSYDNDYRLLSEVRGGTLGGAASYSYDPVGNRTAYTTTIGVPSQTVTSYTHNALDQLVSSVTGGTTTNYSYDARGNHTGTSGGSTSNYTWDALNRLTASTVGGVSSTYAYDAEGRRVRQTVGSTTTNYLWDEFSPFGDVVAELDGSNSQQASYVLGAGELLAQSRGGSFSYYLRDGQGSVRGLTNGSGTLSDSYRYDAYGNQSVLTGTTVNQYGYSGQQTDPATGLQYLRARYYQASTGRFLSRDSLAPAVGDARELNRYSYVANNPISYSDPSGSNLVERAVVETYHFGKKGAYILVPAGLTIATKITAGEMTIAASRALGILAQLRVYTSGNNPVAVYRVVTVAVGHGLDRAGNVTRVMSVNFNSRFPGNVTAALNALKDAFPEYRMLAEEEAGALSAGTTNGHAEQIVDAALKQAGAISRVIGTANRSTGGRPCPGPGGCWEYVKQQRDVVVSWVVTFSSDYDKLFKSGP